MKYNTLLRSLLISSISATCAFCIKIANAEPNYYSGLNVGTLAVAAGIDDEVHTSVPGNIAFDANLGYQFNKNFALEAGYSQYHFSPSVYGVDITAKGILPLSNRFNVFGKFGLGMIRATFHKEDGSETYILPYLGVGAAYRIKPDLDFSIQYQGISVIMANVSILSAGLTYHFG